MTDYYLRAPDQTTWEAAKPTIVQSWIDEIGAIDPDTAYHVNIRTWDAAGDAAVASILAGGQITSITPATPYRVWC